MTFVCLFKCPAALARRGSERGSGAAPVGAGRAAGFLPATSARLISVSGRPPRRGNSTHWIRMTGASARLTCLVVLYVLWWNSASLVALWRQWRGVGRGLGGHLIFTTPPRPGEVRFALRGEGRVPLSDDVLVGQRGQRRKGEHEVLVTGPAGQQLTWQCPFLTCLINKRHFIAPAPAIQYGVQCCSCIFCREEYGKIALSPFLVS